MPFLFCLVLLFLCDVSPWSSSDFYLQVHFFSRFRSGQNTTICFKFQDDGDDDALVTSNCVPESSKECRERVETGDPNDDLVSVDVPPEDPKYDDIVP